MNAQEKPTGKSKAYCFVCRAVIIAVMISPLLLYYGYPLTKYYLRQRAVETDKTRIAEVISNLPPCSGVEVELMDGVPLKVFTDCPRREQERLEEQAERLQSAPLSGPPAPPKFRLPGNTNVPPELTSPPDKPQSEGKDEDGGGND